MRKGGEISERYVGNVTSEIRIDENRHREKGENETREERRGEQSRAEEK